MSYKILTIFLAVVIVLVGWSSLSPRLFKSKSPTQSSQSSTANSTIGVNNAGVPKAEVVQNFFDLGVIKLSDVTKQDYILKNTGSAPLQILKITSNCGCTAGQIIYQNKTSEEYSMGWPGSDVAEINPGDTATIRLIYRPATMPVYGLVGREVYVTTNDLSNSKLVFGIKAIVK